MPQLIYVIPEKPNKNLMMTLNKLKIEVIVYYWKKGKPKFKNIENFI
jgi:hypothetical protein